MSEHRLKIHSLLDLIDVNISEPPTIRPQPRIISLINPQDAMDESATEYKYPIIDVSKLHGLVTAAIAKEAEDQSALGPNPALMRQVSPLVV